jgi:uncharacterized protein
MAELAPADPDERLTVLDALRGLALYGVVLVNFLEDFRVSLFAYLRKFHLDPGRWNHRVDFIVAVFIEQKAMVIFSFLFGVGLGLVNERAKGRGVNWGPFLLRRYAVLLGIGLLHLLFVWDGDILVEYAVAAFLVIPLLRTRPRTLAVLGALILVWWASPHPPPSLAFPSDATMSRLAAGASRAYGTGSWAEVQAFRLDELRTGILPLLVSVLPRTVGLFLLGIAASSLVRSHPRGWLIAVAAIGLPVGGVLAIIDVLAAEGVLRLGELRGSVGKSSELAMGLGYAGAFMLAWERTTFRSLARHLAPIGRMALTSYLTQSLIGIALCYHVGLGLMNRLGAAAGAAVATGIFVAQAFVSRWWLLRRRFGPLELLWRRLSYGRGGGP